MITFTETYKEFNLIANQSPICVPINISAVKELNLRLK